ncbi:MAG: hypothetical protein HG456_001165 [candidate division SR1 bacterium]|nr:hypothetical protein [candidate division SR1 bacterium]
MNLGNLKNSAEEALKKGKNVGKNLFAVAIMTAVTSCGPGNKNTDNRIPQDPIKTEVAKDSTKTVIPQDNTEAPNDELAELDEILEEADEAHAEIQAELKEELEKTLKELKLTKKEYAERTEAYHTAEEARNIAEGYFKKFLKTANAPRDKEWLGLVKETITEYKEVIKILNEPESKLARETQKLYEQKAAEVNANK